MAEHEDRLETKLIKDAWVNASNFVKAQEEQARSGKSLYATLIRLGYLSEERVYEFFSQQSLIPFVKLTDYKIDPAVVRMFPERSYRRTVFATFKDRRCALCGDGQPLDTNLIGTLETQSGLQIYILCLLALVRSSGRLMLCWAQMTVF